MMPLPVPLTSNISQETPFQQLQRITDGLLFVSESEAAVLVVQIPVGAAVDLPAALRAAAQLAADAPVREQPLEAVLGERANPPAGAGQIDIRQAPAYLALLRWLQTQVREARAFRVGNEAPQALFLIGKAADGSWIGVRTTTVDT